MNGGSYVNGPKNGKAYALNAFARLFQKFACNNDSLLCSTSRIQNFLIDFINTFPNPRVAAPACAENPSQCINDVAALLKHIYNTDPLKSAVIACIFVSFLVWFLGVISGDLSWVDRLWSILPPFYMLHFLSYAPADPRLQVMFAVITLWGIRLTYNFWRKGKKDFCHISKMSPSYELLDTHLHAHSPSFNFF